MTQEDLKAIGTLMDMKLQPIIERLDTLDRRMDTLDQRMDALEESQEETRNGVNMLINWSEKVSMAATFPLPDIDD